MLQIYKSALNYTEKGYVALLRNENKCKYEKAEV